MSYLANKQTDSRQTNQTNPDENIKGRSFNFYLLSLYAINKFIHVEVANVMEAIGYMSNVFCAKNAFIIAYCHASA